ncbi:thioredoxin family protein [Neobittarella massiliensis]|nr:Uncharacterised protein [uncultured Anaerotruncus sp.]
MARPVKMMYLESCPYCQQAFSMVEQLVAQHPEYGQVEIETVEESREPEKTKGLNYWYVPTYFVGDEKVLEGVPTLEKVEQVFIRALQS